jgi:glutathione synthase/RimK-type ligase-like ATP-grasp enzyme
MQIYDVCLMSDWHYDRDLLEQLENRLQCRGRSTYLVWPENLDDVLERLRRGTLGFRYLVDRASNTSEEFLQVYRCLPPPGAACFEEPGVLLRASDKALMHREFQAAGIPVPHTLIIQPHTESEEIQIDKGAVQELGPPFVIKPANTTGGGLGVFQDGRSLEDILHRRREYPSDKYLVQERILAKVEQARRFWFRIFYVTGVVHCCWWDDRTHVYAILQAGEVEEQLAGRFVDIARKIARITCLQLFSVEIAVDHQERLVVVDYVNESPDLRRKSQFIDGVPDGVVESAAENLARWILSVLNDLQPVSSSPMPKDRSRYGSAWDR